MTAAFEALADTIGEMENTRLVRALEITAFLERKKGPGETTQSIPGATGIYKAHREFIARNIEGQKPTGAKSAPGTESWCALRPTL